MLEMIESVIQEIDYQGLLGKQRSIDRLFPTFYDRVKKVANAGGVRYVGAEGDEWAFDVHSSDKKIWYGNVVRFKEIEDTIRKHVRNKALWRKDGSGIDLRLLADEVLYDCDLQIFCACPAFLYWGAAYILSLNKYQAKWTEPETRPPNIRNPKQYGAMCKHAQLVFDVLPFYVSTMANFLKVEHGHVIEAEEAKILKEEERQRKTAEEEEEEEQQPPEAEGEETPPKAGEEAPPEEEGEQPEEEGT